MARVILAILYNVYMCGESMFKGGGCVLYFFLFGSTLLCEWIHKTKLLSLNAKIVVCNIILVILLAIFLLFTYWRIRCWWKNRK